MRQSILVIDDSEAIHALLRARLQSEPVELRFAPSGEEGIALAMASPPDLILLDIDMPAPDGFEVCRRLKADMRTMQIPIVFLTGNSSTEQKIQGLELGATDYITKPFESAELRARIRATLRAKYLMDLLSKKALLDGLTGLWNRIYFESRLAGALAERRESPGTFSCLMIDMDHFKQINDTHGHLFGDEVLRGVGRILTDCCRDEDVACRYGGEEFVVLVGKASAEHAARLAERIRGRVQEHGFVHKGNRVEVTCSIGVADLQHIPPPGVVELADKALYRAKHEGRNRISIARVNDELESAGEQRRVA
jgi:two-component system, cell cycle response regulator